VPTTGITVEPIFFDRDYNSALLIKKLAVGSSQDKTLPSLKDLLS
jgi:hypothetical protein